MKPLTSSLGGAAVPVSTFLGAPERHAAGLGGREALAAHRPPLVHAVHTPRATRAATRATAVIGAGHLLKEKLIFNYCRCNLLQSSVLT